MDWKFIIGIPASLVALIVLGKMVYDYLQPQTEITASVQKWEYVGKNSDGRNKYLIEAKFTNSGNQSIKMGELESVTIRVCSKELRRPNELPPSIDILGVKTNDNSFKVRSKHSNLLQLTFVKLEPDEYVIAEVPLLTTITDLGGVFFADGDSIFTTSPPPNKEEQLCKN